jgi:hypothetical protein
MSTNHAVPDPRWTSLCVTFVGAAFLSFIVLFLIRQFHIPISDGTTLALACGFQFIGLFLVLQSGPLRFLSSLPRWLLSALFALILSATAFWIAFIVALGLFLGIAS